MLKPKCLNLSDLNRPVRAVMGFTYSARGWILPCCHTDGPEDDAWFEYCGLLDEHLRLENVDNVEEILDSPEWEEFRRILLEEPEKAPPTCHRVCGRCRT